MRRLLIGLLIGAALGFAGGWVAFGADLAGDGGSRASQTDVEREVAKQSGTGYAACHQRQYPENAWDCTTRIRNPLGEDCVHDWAATVGDSGTVGVSDKGAEPASISVPACD